MHSETRIAQDGRPYTLSDFLEYYGDNGNTAWENTWQQQPPPPPSVTGPPGQQHPQAQAAASDAGAPQLGAYVAPLMLSPKPTKHIPTQNRSGRKRKKQEQPEECADAMLEHMRNWYEDRLDDRGVCVAWKRAQRCLFRTETVPLDGDVGDDQPGGESEGQIAVASKEHVARQVREIIIWREKWLAQEGLPKNTLMNEKQKYAFLKASKEEYHSRPEQVRLQERDASAGGKHLVRKRMKSRWSRNLQRLAGTAHMWYLLSFTGRFSPAYFDKLPPPPPSADELKEELRQNTTLAVEARAELRLANSYARLRDTGAALSEEQEKLLAL